MSEKDRDLLEKVKNSMKCGNVYFQKELRKNHAQCYRYTAGSHRDVIEKIIPFFKKHPLQSTSKQKSFECFCKIAHMIKTGKHRTKKGIEQVRKLKARMNHKTIGLA